MKKEIKQVCDSCHGSGLYCGFMEPKGEAVICLSCNGRGWYFYSYEVFTHRIKKKGVKIIRVSQGSFIATGVGGIGNSMTYKEFEKRYPVAGK